MLRGVNPGRMDHVLTFYKPVKAKDAIGDLVTTPTAQQGTVKAEKIFKRSDERIEANQQVGITVHEFRIHDIRSQHAITLEWQFDCYQINRPGDVGRYKILGIETEGRGNTLKLTAELRDND